MFYVIMKKRERKKILFIRYLSLVKLWAGQKIGWCIEGSCHSLRIHTPILARARAPDNDNERSRRGNPFDLAADFVFSLRMISPSKRDTLWYTSADVLAWCDDRDSLRHANSVREQVQRQPPVLAPPSHVRAPGTPGLFLIPPAEKLFSCNFHREQNFVKLSGGKVRAAHTCAPRVCARALLARHVRVRPTIAGTI